MRMNAVDAEILPGDYEFCRRVPGTLEEVTGCFSRGARHHMATRHDSVRWGDVERSVCAMKWVETMKDRSEQCVNAPWYRTFDEFAAMEEKYGY
ncbi:MAG: hypothetical protein M1493_03500 [Firmicutes bacterium]|nr:hypothetical protein [Bacillota bacterium]